MSRQILIALIAGILFGAGLAVSGMADPERVRAFLDIFGAWDPTLAFVMSGALLPMAVAWRVRAKLKRPLVAPNFDLPSTTKLDKNLLIGAALFGMGWGIAGLCPGPAIADFAVQPWPATIFVAAMFTGMILWRLQNYFSAKRSSRLINQRKAK